VTGQGLEDLLALARPGVTLALLGPSGAGKSTLGNALLGGDPLLPTGQVRADGKGRHTTVRRELTPLPSGAFLLDTPGLRSIALTGAVTSGLDEVFDDLVEQVTALAESCRFRNCSHEAEPGCAVLAAAESGELAADRLGRWRSLRRETAYQAAREDKRLAAERQAQWKRIHRELRRAGRSRP
jgi:ribosome biogenesis GTPase